MTGDRRERDVIKKWCAAIRAGYLERDATQATRSAEQKAAKKALKGSADGSPKGRAADRTPARPPWDTKLGYLKIEVYALARYCKKRGWGRHIERLANKAASGPIRGPAYFNDNPFHWTLLAVEAPINWEGSAGSPDKPDSLLPSSDRSRLATELLCADRLKVLPHYLIGFISQSGGLKELRKWPNRHESNMFKRFAELKTRYEVP